MISKATLKKYDFICIEQYFLYIIDSQINGNSQQVKDLFKKLDNSQKRLFMNYIQDYNNEMNYNFNLGGLY